MFSGDSIDELIAMVELAERRAVEMQAAVPQAGPALIYESQRQEVLEGVA